ncbi:MAG: hypothetical protein EP297_07050 [Gammaproteobacteria bacterium]|nr:MAG: hypothetical protein EP297_07050 [Gammaproteobacteria bacterium]
MNNDNPYAAPESNVVNLSGDTGIWQQKKLLIIDKDTELPDRCIKCNQPAHGYRKRKRLDYYHPIALIAIILLIFIFWPVALILALIFRRSVTIEYGLCIKHRRRLLTLALSALGLLILSIIGAIASVRVGTQAEILLPVSITAFLLALIPAMLHAYFLRSGKIDTSFIRIKGTGKAFRQSFPYFEK